MPYLNVISPINGFIYSNSNILINISSNFTSNIWFLFNNSIVNYNSPFSFAFSNGFNSVTFYANNSLGMVNTTINFYVNNTQTNTSILNSTSEAVSNLTLISKGINYLVWNWTNPNDSNFFQSIIYINGLNILNTTDNNFNLTGLQQNTSYTIDINTESVNGNINYTNVQ